MSKKTVPLAQLVEDYSLYPRHQVSDIYVKDLVRALEAGAVLPIPVVDEATWRIVDGFHRVRAYRKHLGEEAKIQVEVRRYDSEGELFLDAARLNAGHGRKLDRHDQVRIVYRARELGVSDERIAVSLQVPAERVAELEVRIAYGPAGAPVATKLGAEHLGGRTVTAEQINTIHRMRGAAIRRPIRELTELLESGVANLDDPAVRQQLAALAALITSRLEALAAAV